MTGAVRSCEFGEGSRINVAIVATLVLIFAFQAENLTGRSFHVVWPA